MTRLNDLLGLSYMPPVVEDADGKFGAGYTVEQWVNGTNNYHWITYYIESDGE